MFTVQELCAAFTYSWLCPLSGMSLNNSAHPCCPLVPLKGYISLGLLYDVMQEGKYQDSSNFKELHCKQCQTGQYQDQKGQSICKHCPSGKTNNNVEGATALDDCAECMCEAGKYPLSDCTCKNCLQGRFSEHNDASACETCPGKLIVCRVHS